MNDWEFTFEQSAWDLEQDKLHRGGALSAVRFLTLLEEESDETVENALQDLQDKNVILDISDLPKDIADGETARRLRLEAQLVKEGKLPAGLEENDPLRLYLEEVASIPVCGDVQLLAQRCLSGEETAMERLTNALLSRVIERAFFLAGRGVLLLDLIQEGSLGLWQGILSYSGGDILTHCDRYIEMTMAKTITLQARAAGVGQRMRKALEDYRDADQRLLTQLGRNPTLEEIALELHMGVEEAMAVKETLDAARLVAQAKAVPAEEEEAQAQQQAVEDTAYFQMRQRISELLSTLSEQDAKLLTLRFGLEGGLPMSPEDTGRKLGMTSEEVIKREAAALAKLRTNG